MDRNEWLGGAGIIILIVLVVAVFLTIQNSPNIQAVGTELSDDRGFFQIVVIDGHEYVSYGTEMRQGLIHHFGCPCLDEKPLEAE